MPFMNAADLRTSIKAWSKRNDFTDAECDDFVTLFESEIFSELRIRAMEVVDDAFAISDRLTALPTGFRELRSIVSIGTPSYPLKLITPQSAAEAYDYATPTNALSYMIEGTNLRVEPLPTAFTARLDYYKALDSVPSAGTNWLYTNYPGLYLFGALRYTAPYVGNDERVGIWEASYQSLKSKVIAEDARAKRAGSQPGMRLKSTP